MSSIHPKRTKIDWDSMTFEGSEREQLLVWSRLTVQERLEACDALCTQAREFIAWRKSQNLPYIDAVTGNVVRPPYSETC